MTITRSVALGLLTGLLAFSGLMAAAPAALACPLTGCEQEEEKPEANPYVPQSDPSESTSYNSPAGSAPKRCHVFASGTGIGSYCVGGGGATLKTLRERFGNQTLQACRYTEIPDGVEAPFNARPDEGRYMLMTCLANIDFDTYSGGPDRIVETSVVFVPNGTDIADVDNPITNFLWRKASNRSNPLPVPFMQTRPNPVPLVGIPTYFTFRWVDPNNGEVVATGPYADKPGGGPLLQVDLGDGVTMRAEATRIVVDPQQKGIDSVVCDPSTPYLEGVRPSGQPAKACQITFPRTSASARQLATAPIPPNVDDAFYAAVEVHWRVTYGQPGSMRELGDGFVMRLRQVLPVQEVQAPNQPPAVIY